MMDVARPLEELTVAGLDRDTALTVGVFDGVHRGHLHLLNTLMSRAKARGLAAGVITLHPHPALVLDPRAEIAYLTSLEVRVRLLQESGVDFVLSLTFTPEVAHLSAAEFVAALRDQLRMRFLLVGPDFALGRDRQGNAGSLSELGKEMGFEVEPLTPLVEDGVVVSSSAIRSALEAADIDTVNRLLGRPFSLHGPIVRGVERGRIIGFPTANIATGSGLALPPFGVYVTRSWIDGVARESVTNIGRRPTFDDGERTIEVHIMDFDGDLYGKEVRVDVLKRLRGEVRFDGAEALSEQIRRDVAAARQYFEAGSPA
ncbi:MAG TPA: riboflavin biosynthesis protein RibF [Dehalococcoidia bacterium]|nr:riboflavin biosynthesis protein RibF [Dehalococcoidia bacterium]